MPHTYAQNVMHVGFSVAQPLLAVLFTQGIPL